MKNKGSVVIPVIIVIIIVIGLGWYLVSNKKVSTPTPISNSTSTPPTTTQPKLGEQFTLHKGEVIQIGDTGLAVTIINFYNSPCPAGAQCIWSGLGVELEYRLNGQIEKGMNLAQAFGYQTTIVKTDYQTYADLVVNK